MEEDKKLYPFKFCTLQDDYTWGSDRFCLADLGYRDSLVKEGWLAGNSIGEIMDMYMDRIVGENVFSFWGRQFPVQVKRIFVNGNMPLRVHPDAETAEERYDFLGREKFWYVTRAGKGAEVAVGFRRDTDATELYNSCLDGSARNLLKISKATTGMWFHIAPGTPHCAFGDVEVLEVSESSPLDFCLCPWGETVSEEEFDPALNMIDALDFIDYHAETEAPCVKPVLLQKDEFVVKQMDLKNALKVNGNESDTMALYSCIAGSASVRISVEGTGTNARFALTEGETILVPAECADYLLVPESDNAVLLETTIPNHVEKDAYINPDVAPTLPEDKETLS